MKKRFRTITAVVLVASLLLLLSACGNSEAPATSSGQQMPSSADAQTDYQLSTRFLPYPEYDGTVKNEEDAEIAINDMADLLGGDKNMELICRDATSNEEGTVFYSFEQALGGIQIHNTSAKLIVDKDGKIIGASGTIASGLEPSKDTAWEITQEEAEQIASEYTESGEHVISGVTGQTLLPNPETGNGLYAWIVYTNNTDPEIDRSYLANYITGTGDYLGAVPVTEPGNSEALNGSVSVFAFEGFDKGEWTGTIVDPDGTEREITVPVMIDKDTGLNYLGDQERKVLCADWKDFEVNKTLTPVTSADSSWNNNELATYEMILRVWDFYNEIGWEGPDGDGSPTLLLMNMLDENGDPPNNAFYSGTQEGFQVFCFNDYYGEGSCSDVVGHEYTHAVTNTSQIENLYQNDSGAINEALSDIMGNLIEMSFGDSPGGEWIFGEKEKSGASRSLKDPHAFLQPEFTWDKYYVPNVIQSNDFNDYGGVHTNSSLLNYVSYKLSQAGMPLEDQIYFWLNVILATTSTTDYPALAKLLPWCMEITGYSEYKEALTRAIQEGQFEEIYIPDSAPEDGVLMRFSLPENLDLSQYATLIRVQKLDAEKPVDTWPVFLTREIAGIYNGGDSIIMLYLENITDTDDIQFLVLTQDGWKSTDLRIQDITERCLAGELPELIIPLENGTVFTPETDSLAELLN